MSSGSVAVLRPRSAAAGRPGAGLDTVRLEARPDAVVAVDGRGRAHRFPRANGDAAPHAVGWVDDRDAGPRLAPGRYFALLDGRGRALARHLPADAWDPGEVAAFAAAAGLGYQTVEGPLRIAPGGVDLGASPAKAAVRVAIVAAPLAAAALTALGVAPFLVTGALAVAAIAATGVAVRYVPPRR